MTDPAARPVAARLVVVRRMRLVALMVLVVGWLAAAVVFAVAPVDDEGDGEGDRIVDGQRFSSGDASARELQQLARLGGTAAVVTFKFDRWFTSLWQGRPLAYTLATLSLLLALGCLHMASLMAEEPAAPS